jgi:hypothetical protein
MSSRALVALAATVSTVALSIVGGSAAGGSAQITRAAVPPGAIDHIIVVELENEDFTDTSGRPLLPRT